MLILFQTADKTKIGGGGRGGGGGGGKGHGREGTGAASPLCRHQKHAPPAGRADLRRAPHLIYTGLDWIGVGRSFELFDNFFLSRCCCYPTHPSFFSFSLNLERIFPTIVFCFFYNFPSSLFPARIQAPIRPRRINAPNSFRSQAKLEKEGHKGHKSEDCSKIKLTTHNTD